MRNRFSLVLVTVILMAFTATTVFAEGQAEETYPRKSADFLIPFGAGGSADTIGRALANATEPYFDQPIVAVNRPGGGGGVMYQALKDSDADGYTLGWSSTSVLTSTNIGNVPFMYDVFDHVARIGYTSMPLAVLADSPWDTLEEFVAAAKANPGELLIGNAGTGSATHLTSIVFATKAGIDVIHLPNGAERRVPALLGGETQAIVVPLPEIAPFVESGDAKILAFPTVVRDGAYPDVPTMREVGYDVVIELFRGIAVPKGMDASDLDYLEDAFRSGSEDPAFKDIAEKQGFVVDFMGRSEYEAYLADQNALISDAMDAGGLR